MKFILRAVLSCTFLVACAAQPKPAPEAAAPAAAAAAAPPPPASGPALVEAPFTAEQIRAATSVGRTYEFKLEAPGQPALIHRITFTAVTTEQASTQSVNLDESGAPLGEPDLGTATWEELAGHAAYAQENTVVSDDEAEVPAGKFPCRLYTVTEGPVRSRVYFAKDLPGAPVLMIVEKDGQVVQTMTLVRHVAGG